MGRCRCYVRYKNRGTLQKARNTSEESLSRRCTYDLCECPSVRGQYYRIEEGRKSGGRDWTELVVSKCPSVSLSLHPPRRRCLPFWDLLLAFSPSFFILLVFSGVFPEVEVPCLGGAFEPRVCNDASIFDLFFGPRGRGASCATHAFKGSRRRAASKRTCPPTPIESFPRLIHR